MFLSRQATKTEIKYKDFVFLFFLALLKFTTPENIRTSENNSIS